MLTLGLSGSLSSFAPIPSALAALTAIGVSLWVADRQRRIQEAQFQQSPYEKRYAIYHSLRSRGKWDEELSVQMTDAVQDLIGPVLQERSRLFGPYLRLGGDTAPESEARVMLNGWQRLWIVIIAIGLFPTVRVGYELWPMARIAMSDACSRMNREDAGSLIECPIPHRATVGTQTSRPQGQYTGANVAESGARPGLARPQEVSSTKYAQKPPLPTPPPGYKLDQDWFAQNGQQ